MPDTAVMTAGPAVMMGNTMCTVAADRHRTVDMPVCMIRRMGPGTIDRTVVVPVMVVCEGRCCSSESQYGHSHEFYKAMHSRTPSLISAALRLFSGKSS
jgi:hypothetical protein